MTIRSRWTEPVPECSIQQWIFGSSQGVLSEKRLLIDAERPDTHHMSKAEYRLLSKRVALGLQAAGLQQGDRVLLFSGNTLYYPAIFVGVLMAGGIFTGANPTFVERELTHQLRNSGARFMVSAAGSLDTALAAAEAVGLPRSHVFVMDDYADTPAGVAQADWPTAPGKTIAAAAAAARKVAATVAGKSSAGGSSATTAPPRHWLQLVAGNRQQALGWDWTEPADVRRATCCLNYSSGTTGLPKGVDISHYAYVANGVGVVAMGKDDAEVQERRARTVGLCFLPLYHAFGQTYFVANFVHMEVPTYMMPRFDFERMLQHVQRFRITSLTLAPPIAVALAKHPVVRKYDLSSIDSVGCGAAPLSDKTSAAVEKLWPAGQVTVRQGWGMTEVTCTCMNWAPDSEGPPQAVGELAANCAARLVAVGDEAGDGSSGTAPAYITQANTPGELWVSGPTLMTGYWQNPEATAETIYMDPADGTRWLKTGDIAYVDGQYRDGSTFVIVDRRKELIKVKGSQVAPAELEALLLERDDVADAAVIGVHIAGDPETGQTQEHPRAYIVRAPRTAATAADIQAWTAERVAPFKRLTGGVVFVDAIPKNPSGKILRKTLRDRASKEEASKPSKL